MSFVPPPQPPVRREAMRIAGRKVFCDETIDVHDPYTNRVVGTVPAGRPEHVREALAIGHGYSRSDQEEDAAPPSTFS